jgi:hypothetical protein
MQNIEIRASKLGKFAILRIGRIDHIFKDKIDIELFSITVRAQHFPWENCISVQFVRYWAVDDSDDLEEEYIKVNGKVSTTIAYKEQITLVLKDHEIA